MNIEKFISKCSNKQGAMQRNFGVTNEQFNLLVKQITPLWKASEKKRLSSRADRKRGIGAGHPYAFSTMREKLAVILFYLKAYMTQELLGLMFEVDQSAISRLLHKILPLIEAAADPELKIFLQKVQETCKKEKIKTLAELTEKFPELREAQSDTTEQRCYRSSNYEKQKKYYSGKTKKHAVKTQITTSITNRILDVSGSYPGSMHDKAIIDEEKTIPKIPEQTPHRFDSGFQGVRNEYPNHYLILPIKKPKNGELSDLEKEHNTAHSRRRVKVEHGLSRLKKFKILANVFRNSIKVHNQVFRGIAAILNFRLANTVPVI